jgi:heat shock protein HslJ
MMSGSEAPASTSPPGSPRRGACPGAMMGRWLFRSAVLLVTVSMLGCAGRDRNPEVRNGDSGQEAPLPSDAATWLQGGEWKVVEIGGAAVIDTSEVTLIFAPDGTLSGVASCNNYTTRYTLTADQLAVSEIVTTRKACPPPLMIQEQAFLDGLKNSLSLSLRDDGALVLHLVDGKTLIARRG